MGIVLGVRDRAQRVVERQLVITRSYLRRVVENGGFLMIGEARKQYIEAGETRNENTEEIN